VIAISTLSLPSLPATGVAHLPSSAESWLFAPHGCSAQSLPLSALWYEGPRSAPIPCLFFSAGNAISLVLTKAAW